MTNEEFIRDMNKEELGNFLCGLSIKCDKCELKDLCRTKYQKGFYNWLGDECKGNIDDGFWSIENLPDYRLNRDFTPWVSLDRYAWKDIVVDTIKKFFKKVGE